MAAHDRCTEMVRRIIEIKELVQANDTDPTQARREINAHERTINRIIFRLYGLDENALREI